MAALRLATRRHCPALKPPSLLRLFSSEPKPPFLEELPIKPVSYAAKPEPEPEPQEAPMTRQEARFVKDAPSAASFFPSRVAPLPADVASPDPFGGAAPPPPPPPRRSEMLRRVTRISWKSPLQEEEERLAAASPFPLLLRPKRKDSRPLLDLAEAIRQVKAGVKCRFDETVEAHVRLGIDAKRAGKGVRGGMSLPHGSGKVVKVAFFAEGKHAEEARAAGADIVGGAELIEEIAVSKKLNVDKCFATSEMVLRMGKISRILRERGLWPDRKLGTVTNDVSEALEKVRQGHIEFKMDKTAIVHVGVGKVSYSEDNIRENIGAFVNALLLAKPAGLKKTSKYAGYINSFHICSTMGPGYPVSIQSISKAADQYNKLQLK